MITEPIHKPDTKIEEKGTTAMIAKPQAKLIPEKTDPTYVGIKAKIACVCGHSRRVHVVIERGPKPDLRPLEWGQCLGATRRGPMTCDCPAYGK